MGKGENYVRLGYKFTGAMRVLETVEAPFVASLSVETSAQAADFANAFFNSPYVKEGSAETNAALGAMEVSETEDG